MINSPCKDCTDREIGCHSICENYKYFRRKLDEYKNIVCSKKKEERDLFPNYNYYKRNKVKER